MSIGLSGSATDGDRVGALIQETDSRPTNSLPTSATNMAINCVGLACLAATVLFVRNTPNISLPFASLVCVLAYALPVVIVEMALLKTHRRPSTGLDLSAPRPIAWYRVGVKLVGLYGTIGIIGATYLVLPEYKGDLYRNFWWLLRSMTPLFVVGAIPYFALVDRYMRVPEDGYWHAGRVFLGHWGEADPAVLRQYVLGWLVKAFFLPLMFGFIAGNLGTIARAPLDNGFESFYVIAWNTLIAVDVIIGCSGYVFTLRIFDSHIRSAEPTVGGWLVAIVCYPPIWNGLYNAYFKYNDGLYWGTWLSSHPSLYCLWGSAILALMAVYASATVVFGVRFSNLTHRGVITGGPYRFTKHPAYVSKNLAWWLISVPFVSLTDWDDAVQHCLMLIGVNVIYLLRARTEERHMSRDRVYVAYALAMNDRSIFRWLGRLIPVLRYRPPEEAVAWRRPPELQTLEKQPS